MRATLLLLLLAVAGGLAFWLSRSAAPTENNMEGLEVQDSNPQGPAEVSETPDRINLTPLRDSEDGPSLRGEAPMRAEVNEGYPLEIDLVLIQPGADPGGGETSDPNKDLRAGAKAVLRGRLHDDEGNPIVGRAVFVGGANKGREIPCAADGTFLASDLYPGLSVVRLETGSGVSSVREVRLGQFGNTEVNVSFGVALRCARARPCQRRVRGTHRQCQRACGWSSSYHRGGRAFRGLPHYCGQHLAGN